MMDQQNYGLGSYGSNDSSLNIPVTKGGAASISPFLNVDPNYLNLGGPQFIIPSGQARTRGRFELAFSQIGSSVMAGITPHAGVCSPPPSFTVSLADASCDVSASGAIYGALNGARVSVRESLQAESKQLAGKVKFSQALTQVTKQGATAANAIGVIVLMYNIFGLGIAKFRGEEDEINTLGAATLTGVAYKSSRGLKPMAAGGAAGFALSALWCLYQNKDKVKSWDSNSL